jgi:hypothetical protein
MTSELKSALQNIHEVGVDVDPNQSIEERVR